MRLIDADALFTAFENSAWFVNADRDDIAEEILMNAPTINPTPDPVTGLVPCGCGGVADTDSGYWNIVYCTECRMQTGSFADIKDAKANWNRAMGYKGAE